ncbi:MAG: class II aldolase/adducin family protein [Spirochaetaceae bacterium]|jgi:rhamnose utilization protein RhaD (predicted bifunctional aldolase and dehydrogenase)|nr:class II aldolase/adducin family protein [Spirochaetaceae bacterium]
MSITELTAISRFYGADPDYIIAGGGNTSFKDESTLYIKGSGMALADVNPESFVSMDRRALGEIWNKTYSQDADEREKAVLADMMAARRAGEEGKRPSVETLLHDMLPFVYVVHTHPALVNGLTCSMDGEKAAADLFGADHIWIPSTNPGYILSLAVKEAMEKHRVKHGKPAALIFLQNHGVFVGADDTPGIKEQYRRVMERIGSRIRRQPDSGGELAAWGASGSVAGVLAKLAAAAGGGETWKIAFLRNNEIAAMVRDRASFYPLSSAFSPDHIVYAGSDPLFVESPEAGGDTAALEKAWKERIDGADTIAGGGASRGRIPKIVALQGMGVFGIGTSEKGAKTALQLFNDAVKIAVYAESFGGPRFMARDQIDFINNWEVERYRSKVTGTAS